MASNPQPVPHTYETESAMTLIDTCFECLFPQLVAQLWRLQSLQEVESVWRYKQVSRDEPLKVRDPASSLALSAYYTKI